MKEIKIKSSDEILYTFKAPTGLPVYMWVNDKKENTYISLGVKYGSINTEFKCNNISYKVPSGIAHFLEHIKFHLKDKDASELFFDLGCDSNAYTANEETVFEVYANNNIYEATKLLLDFVYDDYISNAYVESERAIILEEANSNKDNPNYAFYQEFLNNFYIESNYKEPIIGKEKDIKKITIEDIKLVYDYFYRPENMFMVITGNFDPKEMEKTICNNESKRKFKKIGKIELITKNEPEELKSKRYTYKSKTSENQISKISIKTHLKNYKNYSKDKVLIAIKCMLMANFGNSSDIYEELMQNDYVSSFYTTASIEDNIIGIDFNFQSKDPEKVYKYIIDKLKVVKMDDESLKRIKNYTKAQFIIKFDNIYTVASSIIISLIENNRPDSMSVDILDKLTTDEINKIFKKIKVDNNMMGSLIPTKKEV